MLFSINSQPINLAGESEVKPPNRAGKQKRLTKGTIIGRVNIYNRMLDRVAPSKNLLRSSKVSHPCFLRC